MNFPAIISKLCAKEELSSNEAGELMAAMVKELTDSQIAAALVALKLKGVTAGELCSFASVMRALSIRINPNAEPLIDSCGTGGDGSSTFNISTATAIVLSACGVFVAKHGNRCVSSGCGSADVLEMLGVNISMQPEQAKSCIEKIGIGFLFAPSYHPAFRNVSHIRKELGIRTVFNMLGPLLNPAGVSLQLIGVYEPELTELFALALKNAGARDAMVVHGEGLDELTVCGRSKISHLKDGIIKTFYLEPKDAGLKRYKKAELLGGTAEQNAGILLEILHGEKSARRDIVLLNAAAGLIVAGKAADFMQGVSIAAKAIDSGLALKKLEELKVHSNAA